MALNLIVCGIILVLAALVLVADLVSTRRGRWRTLTKNRFKRGLISLLTLLALGALALAAYNPTEKPPVNTHVFHLAVVVDVSDSVLRSAGGWTQIQRQVTDFLRRASANLPLDVDPDSPASIISFRGTTSDVTTRLVDLPIRFAQYDPSSFAGGEGSDLGAGLDRAAQDIQASGQRGEILLISDGNDTYGGARAQADRSGALGIPITVIPITGANPELALASVNLPAQTRAEIQTTLRLIVQNQSTNTSHAILTIQQNDGVTDPTGLFGAAQESTVPIDGIPAQNFGSLKESLNFKGVGLQYVDMQLNDATSGTLLQQRRLFTHVTRPLQILALGDSRWASAISPDVAEITQQPLSEFSDSVDLNRYDTLVVSAVRYDQLALSAWQHIAKAVHDNGLGLMVINGDHAGADEQTETVLRSYHDTVVDDLLPITTDPREYTPNPPPRDIIIMIDASGSMDGWPLQKAKDIANYIIGTLARDIDFVDIVVFTSGADYIVQFQKMTDAAKQDAINRVNSIQSGGGTDPTEALRAIQGKRENCGLIFISDGGFDANIAGVRPNCHAAAFQVNGVVGGNIAQLADPIAVDLSFDPAQVTIPFFNPEKRNKFFEFGTFTALSMAPVSDNPEALPPVPPLSLYGAAVTYERDDAELVAIRPRFIDPVLAYHPYGKGTVGVITTGIPDEWSSFPSGREALSAWLTQTVSYYDRDRYNISLSDSGSLLSLRLEIHNKDRSIPRVDALTVRVESVNGAAPYPVTMKPVADTPATFAGSIDNVPRGAVPQSSELYVEESGLDALPRPQRIPFLIPPAGNVDEALTSEAQSFGVNEALLSEIAQHTGGTYNPGTDYTFLQTAIQSPPAREWWQPLALLAAALFLAAIALRRLGE